jgi:hydroxypyruvate isomerase
MKGNIRHSVCRWCYNSTPLEDLCRAAKQMGLESIELLGPEDWPVAQKHGLTCAMANGPTNINEGVNHLDNHAELIPAFRERITAAAKAGLPNVIVFSGNRRGMSDEQGLENCATFIKQIVGDAEKAGITVCMELLNSKVDHIDYQCDHTPWGVELVKRIGSDRFKLLYDIYHMQIMEGDVIRTIRENAQYIGHYHTAGNPGRHEFTGPEDIQELDYVGIMKAIRDTGFKGFVAQEFIPTRDPMTSLKDAVVMCDV